MTAGGVREARWAGLCALLWASTGCLEVEPGSSAAKPAAVTARTASLACPISFGRGAPRAMSSSTIIAYPRGGTSSGSFIPTPPSSKQWVEPWIVVPSASPPY